MIDTLSSDQRKIHLVIITLIGSQAAKNFKLEKRISGI